MKSIAEMFEAWKSQQRAKREGFRITGHGAFVLNKADGSVEKWDAENLITDDGFDFIADVIGNNTQPADMDNIAVGTGVTAADVSDSTLEAEIARKVAAFNHVGGTKVFTMAVTFDPGQATGALTEAGVLNAAAVGVLLDRLVFPVKNKGAGDSLAVTFTFTMS